MDQLFNQEIPKTESITDIHARIKRQEKELLSLFDNVESTACLIINNGIEFDYIFDSSKLF